MASEISGFVESCAHYSDKPTVRCTSASNLEQFVFPVWNTPAGIGLLEFFTVEIMHPGLAQQAP